MISSRCSTALLIFLMAAGSGLYAEEAPKRNVVFLSVDTLRADRLGCYGYPLPTSPNLDTFAETALLFEDMICEVPLTAPSFCSMLTSRYPRMTGVTRNGLGLDDDTPTVQGVFKQAGYYTFCIQSNWTLKNKLSKLGRGFDYYNDGFHTKRWGFIKAERYGPEVTDRSIKALDKRDPTKPFFAWIHYSDPHAPYQFHRKFNPLGKSLRGLGKIEKTRAHYDSEVAYCDNEIGTLLAALPENTDILFVGDHGESLYEHDYLGHGRRIYQDNMHVPLIIRAPNATSGRTAVPARGIDIGPTLLGMAGLPIPEGMLGVDLLNTPPAADRIRVVETYGGAVQHLPIIQRRMATAPPQWQGVIHNGWKLIRDIDSTELYHLPDDPGELNNLSEENLDRILELTQHITAWNAATKRNRANNADLNEDDLKALDSLGYLE